MENNKVITLSVFEKNKLNLLMGESNKHKIKMAEIQISIMELEARIADLRRNINTEQIMIQKLNADATTLVENIIESNGFGGDPLANWKVDLDNGEILKK